MNSNRSMAGLSIATVVVVTLFITYQGFNGLERSSGPRPQHPRRKANR